MAQGAGKARGVGTGGKKGQSAGSQRKKAGTTRKGKMDVAPKDRAGIAARVQNKKLSSNINKSIEQQMVNAASVGKLTIMANKGGDKVEPGAGKANAKGKK